MLLTVAEYRQFDSAEAFEDGAIQLLLDAAEAEIIDVAGAPDSVTEYVAGGGRYLALAGRASTISSITETRHDGSDLSLAVDDYLLYPAGTVVERLNTGTNPGSRFRGRVAVVYVPADDEQLRKAVQAQLVKIDTTYAPGVTSEQIGAWMEQRASQAQWNAETERQMVLSRLNGGPRMAVV
jgi:hypothetical protein